MSNKQYKVTLTRSESLHSTTWWSATIQTSPGFGCHNFDAKTPEQALAGLAVYLAAHRVLEE